MNMPQPEIDRISFRSTKSSSAFTRSMLLMEKTIVAGFCYLCLILDKPSANTAVLISVGFLQKRRASPRLLPHATSIIHLLAEASISMAGLNELIVIFYKAMEQVEYTDIKRHSTEMHSGQNPLRGLDQMEQDQDRRRRYAQRKHRHQPDGDARPCVHQ